MRLLLLCFFTITALFADAITVDNAYVREVPPTMPNSAAFMKLTNHTGKNLQLLKATSPIAKTVELHEHVNVQGMMQMQQVRFITVPANGTTHLKPGGLHVMFIGLKKKLKAGEEVPLTLYFSNNTTLTLNAPVKKVHAGLQMGKSKCNGKCGQR